MERIEIYHDNFQNFKRYDVPKAQLILTDVPYNLSDNAYASNPMWYKDGDIKNGESDKAHKSFFNTDENFKPAEFMHFCSQMLIKEPKETGKSPCMVMFCAFEQLHYFIELGARYGLKKIHPARIPQEVLRAGAESEYEDCRQLRIRPLPVPRQIAEVQQRGQDDIQLLRVGQGYGDTEDTHNPEARSVAGEID